MRSAVLPWQGHGLTAKLGTTKSDVLRWGLEALEGQLSDPERHPVPEIIGMVSTAHTPGSTSRGRMTTIWLPPRRLPGPDGGACAAGAVGG